MSQRNSRRRTVAGHRHFWAAALAACGSSHPEQVPVRMDRILRAQSEIDTFAGLFAGLPPCNRDAELLELHPYNGVASSEAMRAAALRIISKRFPDWPWVEAFRALERADEGVDGFTSFMDAYRDVFFMAGVEYARTATPARVPKSRTVPSKARRVSRKAVR